jgi:curved DNA-binding protein CbpA
MDARKDYYAILGVLPTAEDIIVRAAYKALAQRYHPDRANGSKDAATARMREINEAYEVLSTQQRLEYDRARGTEAQSCESYFDDKSMDLPPAFDPLKHDWQIALKYYPDLGELELILSKLSWRLANTFRAHMLEAKAFDKRRKVADTLEQKFLETYFGKNPQILAFARTLIFMENKAAVRELNETIRVLGAGLDAQRVVTRLRSDYGLDRQVEMDKPENMDPYRDFARQLRGWGYDEEAISQQLIGRGLSQRQARLLARVAA